MIGVVIHQRVPTGTTGHLIRLVFSNEYTVMVKRRFSAIAGIASVSGGWYGQVVGVSSRLLAGRDLSITG